MTNRRSKPRQTDALETEILALAQASLSSTKIADKVGVEGRAVRHVLEREQIRRETEPLVKLEDLSLNARQKLEMAIRQHKKQLTLSFRQAVLEEVRRRVDEIILPEWKRQIEEAKTLYERRRGLMDKQTFNTIRRALHPDSRMSISDELLGAAFHAFMGLEKFLLDEKDSATALGTVPSTLADWDAMRQRPRRGNVSSTAVTR